jgi:hypothetical protein
LQHNVTVRVAEDLLMNAIAAVEACVGELVDGHARLVGNILERTVTFFL